MGILNIPWIDDTSLTPITGFDDTFMSTFNLVFGQIEVLGKKRRAKDEFVINGHIKAYL